jgi:hypothetical protein
MVMSDGDPTGTGRMAALDAVARLIANAAPRAIVRIIDCFLIFPGHSPRFADSKSARAGTYHRRYRRQ